MSLQNEVEKKKALDKYTDFELAHELFQRYVRRSCMSKVEFKTVESMLHPGVPVGKNIIIHAGKRNYPIYLFFSSDENIYCVDIDTPFKQTPIPFGNPNVEEHLLVPASMVQGVTSSDSVGSETTGRV